MSGWVEPDRNRPGPPPSPRPAPDRDPGDELVEWVAADGSVIEVVSRRRMRAENLRHRCTYVVVVVGPPDRFAGVDRSGPGSGLLSGADEVVIHLRADWKDTAPSHWDLAFGGVCGAGEAWERSARRELAEEAGIELSADHGLVDLGPVRFEEPGGPDRPGASILGRLYLASWPDRPVSADGEAVAFDRIPLADLDRWLGTVPVCPDSAAVVAPALSALLGPR